MGLDLPDCVYSLSRILPRKARVRGALRYFERRLDGEGIPFHYLDEKTGFHRPEDFGRMSDPSIVVVSNEEGDFSRAGTLSERAGRLFNLQSSGNYLELPEEKRKFAPGYRAYEIKIE